MDFTILETELEEKAQEWYSKGIQLFSQKCLPLKIEFDLTGVRAGVANCHFSSGKLDSISIRFNIQLAAENYEEFVNQIIPHEVAHVIAYGFFGRTISHHGMEWQVVMIKMGKVPMRCHDFSVESVKRNTRSYSLKCNGCGKDFHVGKNLYNKIMGGSNHRCQCGSSSFKSGSDLMARLLGA